MFLSFLNAGRRGMPEPAMQVLEITLEPRVTLQGAASDAFNAFAAPTSSPTAHHPPAGTAPWLPPPWPHQCHYLGAT